MNGAYIMIIPDDVMFKIKDILRDNDDVLILRVENFSEVYKEIFDVCSEIVICG